MSLQIREYSASDGVRLCYRQWADGSHPDALFYLHGIESHSEWFTECAEEIAKLNATVYAPDRRGSGLNQELRGHCHDFRQLADDLVRLVHSTRGSHERFHIAGLSWGGKLVIAIDMLHPAMFSTMTLISPGIFPRVMPGIAERISIAAHALYRPFALHPIPIKDEMFTSVARYLEYIANDPLRLHRVTARFYLESVKLDRFLKKRGYQWSAPTQVLLAENDLIIDNQRVQEVFQSLNVELKRINIYARRNHSLQFEDPCRVAKDIVSWMQMAAPRGCGVLPARNDD